MLFANEGDLANRLMHPSAQVKREYAVRVLGGVDVEITKKLVHGVELEYGKARFEDIVDAGVDGKIVDFMWSSLKGDIVSCGGCGNPKPLK